MNNYDDPHRKASDDYNNGTIDEKMCPLCGTILPGNVRFCTECGTVQETQKRKKEGENKRLIAVFIALAAVVLAVIAVNLVFYILANKENTKKRLDGTYHGISVNVSDISVPEIPNIDEFSDLTENAAASENYTEKYPDGNYRIGEDIPKGTYILTVSDSNFDDMRREAYYAIYSDPECNNVISGKWFESSAIVKLETDGYIKFSWCEAVALDDFDGENSPFEHSGMFRCGIDFEAGTYRLVPTTDQGYQMYYVHENVDSIDYDVIYREGNHGFPEGTEVTVKEGEILELSYCILEKS
ncbi:MAG: hypothetical protein J6B75_00185 [Ruminococcus sp.]|nr:hypothetical protein [Ruminococcus sp.]